MEEVKGRKEKDKRQRKESREEGKALYISMFVFFLKKVAFIWPGKMTFVKE